MWTSSACVRAPCRAALIPCPALGQGAYEIRINIGTQWRVMYVASRKEAVYVLHCFQKKTRTISQKDIDLAERRYRRIGR